MRPVAPWRAPTRLRRNAASSTSEDWRARLGRKVSLRFRLHGDPEHPFSEAIGVVQSVREVDGRDHIEVVDRRGGVVSIAVEDVLAAKLFPLG